MNILLQLDNEQHREVENRSIKTTDKLTSFEEWIDKSDPIRNMLSYNRQIGFCQSELINGIEVESYKIKDIDITQFNSLVEVADYINNTL